MKTPILLPALALAALGLAACGSTTDAGNAATATDTVTLNQEGDGDTGNSDAFEAAGNDETIGNAAGAADTIAAPAGNAL